MYAEYAKRTGPNTGAIFLVNFSLIWCFLEGWDVSKRYDGVPPCPTHTREQYILGFLTISKYGYIMKKLRHDFLFKQECIPVGCVPSAGWGSAGGSAGGVYRGGCVWPGGGCLPGGVCPRRCLAWGCLPKGVSVQGWVSARQPPPPWTESQTPVKTSPCRNYVADSNDENQCDLKRSVLLNHYIKLKGAKRTFQQNNCIACYFMMFCSWPFLVAVKSMEKTNW